jgi:hypothetical protein
MPRKLIVRSAYEKKGAMQFNLSTAAFLFCLDAALKSVCKASGAGVKFERALRRSSLHQNSLLLLFVLLLGRWETISVQHARCM